MSDSRSLQTVRAEATRLLKKYRAAAPENRTPILRSLAECLVEAREHFERPDGTPDWKGRSYPYRIWVRDLYADAHFSRDEQVSVQAAVRYHVGAVLRARLDDDTLREYGLEPETPREKSAGRRHNRTALLQALTARDVQGGSLLSISAAYTVLAKVQPKDLDGLADREAEVAAETLADLERRVKALRKRLADR